MILSDLDLWLLQKIHDYFLKNKEITTWDLAKEYDWGTDWEKFSVSKRKSFLDMKTNSMKYRMQRLAKEGIVSIEKDNGKNHYVIDGNRFKCCSHTFPNGKKKSVLVKDNENKWSAFEL